MLNSLLDTAHPFVPQLFLAFLVLLLVGCSVWVIRLVGGSRWRRGGEGGRQLRLTVIATARVDERRYLVIIRRDNVEHLLMIGGPNNIVVEANIGRPAAALETFVPARPAAATDAMSRVARLGNAGMWPLQPKPAPALRPQGIPPPEEPAQWSAAPEPPPLPAPRYQPRLVDLLAGLAAELSRLPEPPHSPTPADLGGSAPYLPPEAMRQPEPLRERDVQFEDERARVREHIRERDAQLEHEEQLEREPVRECEPPIPPSITDPRFNANADQNLADMGLEAALRWAKIRAMHSAEPAPRAMAAEPGSAQPASAPANPRQDAPAPTEKGAARAKPKPAKSIYDDLAKEMASLSDRPWP
jgi:flagellar protein FliO/FliZ